MEMKRTILSQMLKYVLYINNDCIIFPIVDAKILVSFHLFQEHDEL